MSKMGRSHKIHPSVLAMGRTGMILYASRDRASLGWQRSSRMRQSSLLYNAVTILKPLNYTLKNHNFLCVNYSSPNCQIKQQQTSEKENCP